jgi:hypothetical protein
MPNYWSTYRLLQMTGSEEPCSCGRVGLAYFFSASFTSRSRVNLKSLGFAWLQALGFQVPAPVLQ